MTRDHESCIGLLEIASIARGIEVADAVLKTASVRALFARPFSPGKYAILFTGEVEDVRSALVRGAEVSGEDLLDELILPAVDDGVMRGLDRPVEVPELDAVGIVETTTIASTLLAADAAMKQSAVTMIEVRLAQGIGGKSFFTLTGEVGDVEAATQKGAAIAFERGKLVRRVVVPRAHEGLRELLGGHEKAV